MTPYTEVNAEAVTWGYRLFLDRNPENPDVVREKVGGVPTIEALRKEFLRCEEFKIRNGPVFGEPTLCGTEPPMEIEDVTSPRDLRELFTHIQRTWERFGETEPYWSVLTSENYLRANFGAQRRDEFYYGGKWDTDRLFAALARAGVEPRGFRSCLEYGCGVGRVTHWLAKHFETVHAFDISRAHLRCAEEQVNLSGASNVTFHHVRTVNDLAELPRVDVIYTAIVLQHNPPPLIALIIRRFFEVLNPGGVAFFQVPTYRQGYRFALQEYLSETLPKQEMEMHVLPQRVIFRLAEAHGVEVLEVLEDGWAGMRYKEVSNSFLVRKR